MKQLVEVMYKIVYIIGSIFTFLIYTKVESEIIFSNTSREEKYSSSCDLFHGEWVKTSDSVQYYSHDSCPYISSHQNCKLNGRQDSEFLKWRWKPNSCDLLPFNGTYFLQMMTGKTVAFVGDSVARNQMESLLCILSEIEMPKIRGNKTVLSYLFPKSQFRLVRMWSAWLVREETPSLPEGFPKGFKFLQLNEPNPTLLNLLKEFDVLVINSAHWWVKPAAYFIGENLVGFQPWSRCNLTFSDLTKVLSRGENGALEGKLEMKTRNLGKPEEFLGKVDAFRVAIDTVFQSIAKLHSGLTVFRTISPNHYLGGSWNSGGTCSQFSEPSEGILRKNNFVSLFYGIQMEAYERLIVKEKRKDESRFVLENVTPSFRVRPDGHPGKFRSKETAASSGLRFGKVPEDCLHWCMPGPIDTWNEMLFELINRAFL